MVDLKPYMDLLGICIREGLVSMAERPKGRRRKIHVRWNGVPYTPQTFTPEEAGVPQRP